MRVEFTVFGEKQFSREIDRLGERADNARPAFSKIAKDWIEWNTGQFGSEGARASAGWAPLAPSTVRNRGSAHPILVRSGALLSEMTSPGNMDVADDFLHFSIDGDVNQYGGYHQTGTSKMPQRRPFEFTTRDKEAMVKTLQSWILTGNLI